LFTLRRSQYRIHKNSLRKIADCFVLSIWFYFDPDVLNPGKHFRIGHITLNIAAVAAHVVTQGNAAEKAKGDCIGTILSRLMTHGFTGMHVLGIAARAQSIFQVGIISLSWGTSIFKEKNPAPSG
jgi:hypothetical protein